MTKILLIISSVIIPALGFAQEIENEKTSSHRLTVLLSHTIIPEGINNDKKEWMTLGSWSIDYDYWFHPMWAIGLHTDLIVENFEVEQLGKREAILERSYPVAPAITGLFKPGEHLTLLLGAGGEFTRDESFFLIRLGVEYGWEIAEEWELGISLANDFKIDAYNSWSLGIGISKFL